MTRNGKIARLPKTVQEELNRRLDNNEPGKRLVAWLNSRPEVQAVITAEFGGIKLPESVSEDYRAKYFDFDLYGTVNITDHFGAQAGYRSFDVFYRVDGDEGELKLKGLYFGGVVRF